MASEAEPKIIDYDSDASAEEEFSDAVEKPPVSESSNLTSEESRPCPGPSKSDFEVDWMKEDAAEEAAFKDAFETHSDKEEDSAKDDDDDRIDHEQALKEREEAESKLTADELDERRTRAKNLKKEGNDLYLASENSDAKLKYNEALDICPLQFKEDRAILFANRAAAVLKMGLKEKAIEDCTEAIALNENYVKAIVRRAQVYEDSDKPHEAMKDFQRVLELDPAHKEANLAVMVGDADFQKLILVWIRSPFPEATRQNQGKRRKA